MKENDWLAILPAVFGAGWLLGVVTQAGSAENFFTAPGEFLRNWQGLIAGLLATSAALLATRIAWRSMRTQVDVADARRRDDERKSQVEAITVIKGQLATIVAKLRAYEELVEDHLPASLEEVLPFAAGISPAIDLFLRGAVEDLRSSIALASERLAQSEPAAARSALLSMAARLEGLAHVIADAGQNLSDGRPSTAARLTESRKALIIAKGPIDDETVEYLHLLGRLG